MDLFGAPTRFEPELGGLCQEVLGTRQGVVVVVLALGVDLRLGPSEDPEVVVGSEVD